MSNSKPVVKSAPANAVPGSLNPEPRTLNPAPAAQPPAARPASDLGFTPNPGFQAGATCGFIARGEFERTRLEIENHLWIREMIESGKYKEIVANAAAGSFSTMNRYESSFPEGRFEPLDVFLKMCGTSRATYDYARKCLSALGAEIVLPVRRAGLSWREVRLLSDAPDALKAELRDRIAAGDDSREVLDAVVAKVVELAESRQRAKAEAAESKQRAELSEERGKKAAHKVIELDETVKKLKSELREAREGNLTAEETEISERVERFESLMTQAQTELWGCDFEACPVGMAKLLQSLGRLERFPASLRAKYMNLIDATADGPDGH